MLGGWLTKFNFGPARKGRFICHIGPPKTGTTSVQKALQNLNASDIHYLGTKQPRNTNEPNTLFADLSYAVRSETTPAEQRAIKRRIGKIISVKQYIIVSEEMLLISQQGATYVDKLSRLAQLLKGTDTRLILTLREPVSALKSFYTEIYYRQETRPLVSFEAFLASDQASIFDYPALLSALKSAGFPKVKLLSFTREQADLRLAELTGCSEHTDSLTLETANETEPELRARIDALTVPQALAENLAEGYQHALNLAKGS
ncbi:MAG: hypothetical protein AAF718_15665 [Pseudomonadota bacterium]